MNPHNWGPFIPPNTDALSVNSAGAVSAGWASAIIFFAYIGFDAVSTAAQEAKHPAKGIPAGMLGSLAICTLLYILMSGVMTGLVPYTTLNTAAPVADAIAPYPQLTWLESVGHHRRAGGPHVGHHHHDHSAGTHMADDGSGRPDVALHGPDPRFPGPRIVATANTGVLAASFAGLLPIGILGELVSIGTLVAFIVVCIGVIVLRYTRPDLPPPFPRLSSGSPVWGKCCSVA